jgi:hypothetical protein
LFPIPNGFPDRAILLYSSKIVDKKEILRTVSNTGFYCSSDKVDTVYLIKYIFENSTVNINALWNSCEDMASKKLYSEIAPLTVAAWCKTWTVFAPLNTMALG